MGETRMRGGRKTRTFLIYLNGAFHSAYPGTQRDAMSEARRVCLATKGTVRVCAGGELISIVRTDDRAPARVRYSERWY